MSALGPHHVSMDSGRKPRHRAAAAAPECARLRRARAAVDLMRRAALQRTRNDAGHTTASAYMQTQISAAFGVWCEARPSCASGSCLATTVRVGRKEGHGRCPRFWRAHPLVCAIGATTETTAAAHASLCRHRGARSRAGSETVAGSSSAAERCTMMRHWLPPPPPPHRAPAYSRGISSARPATTSAAPPPAPSPPALPQKPLPPPLLPLPRPT
ncbi:hypothetical protein JKP88DRAFT_346453 [Tribonema minus]|uniref:Uncharacterized protein n=1 Tax=Tribonema minus TaxID=303371 RepID=A0A835ZQC1_9STRA|nr:hypothetical protein JKP88DRAFT_346453 [Tribonema minus]